MLMSYRDGESHPDPVIAQTMENLRDDIDAPASRQSWLRAVLLPVCVAVLIMGIGGAAAYGYLKHDLGQTNSQLSDQVHALRDTQRQLRDTAGVATKLSNQLKQNGIKPSVAVPTVQPSPGPAGAQGAVGPVGPVPSLAQIQRAVAMCFTAGQCAASPTRQQVADAVAKYCLANGRCRGPSGATGQAGSSGASGAPGATGMTGPTGTRGAAGADGKDGAQGPPPTEEQVLSAVSTYCADASNPCQGRKGDTGYPNTITIEVPDTLPDTYRTEICTPDGDHVYTCK